MTELGERMIGDMKLRNFADTTIQTYTRIIQDFARYFHRSPDRLGPEHVQPTGESRTPQLRERHASHRFFVIHDKVLGPPSSPVLVNVHLR